MHLPSGAGGMTSASPLLLKSIIWNCITLDLRISRCEKSDLILAHPDPVTQGPADNVHGLIVMQLRGELRIQTHVRELNATARTSRNT
jgi:hypothetical protein